MLSNFSFAIDDNIDAKFASHGPDHLCIIFFHLGKRIGLVCAEFPGRMDYMSEKTYTAEMGIIPVNSLQKAIELVKKDIKGK